MISLETPIDDRDLLEAISIRFCRHYPVANIARAVGGGTRSTPWVILEQFTPRELIAEASERSLDLSKVETSMSNCECCPRLVVDSEMYAKVLDTEPKEKAT